MKPKVQEIYRRRYLTDRAIDAVGFLMTTNN